MLSLVSFNSLLSASEKTAGRMFFQLLLFFCLGWLIQLPPICGLGWLLAIPLLANSAYRQRLAFVTALSLGIVVLAPFSGVASGAGWPSAITMWLSYGLIFFVLALFLRRVRHPAALAVSLVVLPSVPGLACVLPLAPLSVAGYFYPAWGWWGVACTVCLFATLAVLSAPRTDARKMLWVCGLAGLLVVALSANLLYRAPLPPAAWVGSAIPAPQVKTLDEGLRAYQKISSIALSQARAGAALQVFGENAVGPVPDLVMAPLQRALGSRSVVLGAAKNDGLNSIEKGAWIITGGATREFVQAIQPVPFMEPMYHARWKNIGQTIVVRGIDTSLLICFEASTSIPLYHLKMHQPVIFLANGSWALGPEMAIQNKILWSWGRLFAAPVISGVIERE